VVLSGIETMVTVWPVSFFEAIELHAQDFLVASDRAVHDRQVLGDSTGRQQRKCRRPGQHVF
jgi:hypothetical protein